MQPITLSVDGLTLTGNLFVPKKVEVKHPAVLFIHGWESKENSGFTIAEMLQEKSFISLTFNMRGHKDSAGDIKQATRKDFLNDICAGYDFLIKNPHVDANNIIVVGTSLGGYLGALLTQQRKVCSLIMRVPANYPEEGFDTPHHLQSMSLYNKNTGKEQGAWTSKPHFFHEVQSLQAIHNFLGQILIIESEKDELVPHTVIQSYINAVKNKNQLTYKVMHGVPHSLSTDISHRKAFADIVMDWIMNRSKL